MKQFIKMSLATLTGLIIFGVLSLFLMITIIGGVAALGESTPIVPEKAMLKIDLSNLQLAEQTQEADPIAMIQNGGSAPASLGIWNAITAVNNAAADPSINMIYLKADNLNSGMSHIEEFRTALVNFRTSGKPIISYTEMPSNFSVYLNSVSDKVYMTSHEGGMSMFTGVGTQLIFLKDLLDKLGVNMQLIRHGKYKSAGEMYIRNSSSKENLEQNKAMVTSLWETISTGIVSSRGGSVEELNKAIDELKLLAPQDFVDYGLVDELVTKEELEEKICTIYGAEKIKDVKSISLADYAAAKNKANLKAKEKVAVIYANGEIIDGNGNKAVSGDRFANIIAEVRRDSTVKAVVLRVNSPGGSVLASEKMKVELDLLKEVKPVVASYGDYAASGGYWISNNCDKIFSNATTLTGSIGVFSLIPDVGSAIKKIAHVNITSVNSNAHSDMYSGMRSLTPAEIAYMQRQVEDIYGKFTSIVAEGRDMTVADVDAIAQGRVWTGAEALEIGLVDEIGTIEDAINYAALLNGLEGLDEVQIVEYPKPQTALESILETIQPSEAKIFKGTALESVEEAFAPVLDSQNGQVYARLPYVISIR